MDNNIKGIPYAEATFDKEGNRQTTPTVPPGTTDLIVMSHGWNNDAVAAQALYTKLFTNFADVTAHDPEIGRRKISIVGVLWPSKKFDELMTQLESNGPAPGGAKSLLASDEAGAEAAMREAIDRAAPIFDDPGDTDGLILLHQLVPSLESDASAQATFVETLRALIDPKDAHRDQRHPEDNSDVFFEGQPGIIFQNIARSVPASASQITSTSELHLGNTSDSIGHAEDLGGFFSKAANAVTNLMNLSTYFEMKQRAGTVGKNGVAVLIDELENSFQRVHLVGHSFGGRVVTAAAANSTTRKLRSLSLLQAAFSQNAFSKRQPGFFRPMIDSQRVSGPILVTNTKKDLSVGLAYPAASRLSGDEAAVFGGADDPFGGIGSNGAQRMEPGEIADSANQLQESGASYRWVAGRIHNLRDDRFIVDPNGGDAHGFVFVPEVAWAISRAVIF